MGKVNKAGKTRKEWQKARIKGEQKKGGRRRKQEAEDTARERGFGRR